MVVLLGCSGNFRRWGLVEGSEVTGSESLKGYWDPYPLSSYLLLLPAYCEVGNSNTGLHHGALYVQNPTTMGQASHGLRPQKLCSQTAFLLLSWRLKDFLTEQRVD